METRTHVDIKVVYCEKKSGITAFRKPFERAFRHGGFYDGGCPRMSM